MNPDTSDPDPALRKNVIEAKIKRLENEIAETRSRLKARIEGLKVLDEDLATLRVTRPNVHWMDRTRDAMFDLHDAVLNDVEEKLRDIRGPLGSCSTDEGGES